jgi:hypothetical protein
MSDGNEPIRAVSMLELTNSVVNIEQHAGGCTAHVFFGKTPKAQLSVAFQCEPRKAKSRLVATGMFQPKQIGIQS